MSIFGDYLKEPNTHDSPTTETSGFEAILDKISKNVEEAAQIPFSKRTLEYDNLSLNKRRNGLNFHERNPEISFVSNSRSFSHEYEEQLPSLVSVRSPYQEEIGFLEALNNPEYLQAVKDLSKQLDSSNTYSRLQNNSESHVESDCISLSYVMDEFTIAENNLTSYIAKAKKLLSIGVFLQENDELDAISEKYSETLANMETIFDQLEEIQLSGSNPHQTSQELNAITDKITEHETEISQLELAINENTQTLAGLKRSMMNLKRTLVEKTDSLAEEKVHVKELNEEIARIQGASVDLELEMASVAQEIADMKAQSGNNHPMFKPFQNSLAQLLAYATSPTHRASPPHIDNLANKLFHRIDQLTLTCQEFLRPSIEKETQRGLEKGIVSRIADISLDKVEELNIPPTAVIGAFVLNKLLEGSQPSWVGLDGLKQEAHEQLGVDLEQVEAVIFNLCARDLIVINHSSQQVSITPNDSA
ncbi:hypothetical protein DSO57_1024324 [Entomophthora muscae]|uniref:Uncharacterized protein n=2 Tax=Entomophthora muscae TaxID=34485 RepID=A0ACC2U0J0_9FUNG|nr:hypothetical protein DSO57_1024324 [Entomophthora muscae]